MSENEATAIARILGGTIGPDINLLVSVLATVPAGKLRKQFIGVANGGYLDYSQSPPRDSTYPLEDIYNVLPESSDRTRIAVLRVVRDYQSQGLLSAMALVDALETPDERKSALKQLGLRVADDRNEGKLKQEEIAPFLERAKQEGIERNVRYLEPQ